MTRRQVREQIFKLLFRNEFHKKEEMDAQMALFFEDAELPEDTQAELTEKYNQIVEKQAKIDVMLEEKSVGWSVSRMGKVDLAILRLAVFEILYDDNVPTKVAINEAVELAKKFGQEDSSAFINGILAKFV